MKDIKKKKINKYNKQQTISGKVTSKTPDLDTNDKSLQYYLKLLGCTHGSLIKRLDVDYNKTSKNDYKTD